jgi:endoglucanase
MKPSTLALTAVAAATVSAQNSSTGADTCGKFLFTGVSESCGEFGSGNIPGTLGTDYTWPSTDAIDVWRSTPPPFREALPSLVDAEG